MVIDELSISTFIHITLKAKGGTSRSNQNIIHFGDNAMTAGQSRQCVQKGAFHHYRRIAAESECVCLVWSHFFPERRGKIHASSRKQIILEEFQVFVFLHFGMEINVSRGQMRHRSPSLLPLKGLHGPQFHPSWNVSYMSGRVNLFRCLSLFNHSVTSNSYPLTQLAGFVLFVCLLFF